MKFDIPLLGLAMLAGSASLGAQAEAKPAPSAPNVILLLVDDMGYGDIAAHGNPILRTPNFDRLHNESVRFSNFAVSPSCAPTRAALMTGRHEFLSHVTHTVDPMKYLDPKATTLAQLFGNKGYKTGLFGKWHLGLKDERAPRNRGFEETLHAIKDSQHSHNNPTLMKNNVKTSFKGYRTDILFDNAMDFIERHKDKPFFCYLPTYTPHTPLRIGKKYSDPYEDSKQIISGKFSTAVFNGMVANVDENLGRLLAHLDKLGLSHETLLIAMNDNGGTMGVDVHNSGMRGVKGTGWLGGIRAYSFWRWGNRLEPGPRSVMSGHVDVLPTLADICGLDIPASLQPKLEGSSLLPVLKKEIENFRGDHMQVHHVGRWNQRSKWADHQYANCIVRWNQYYLVRMDLCSSSKCGQCRKQPKNENKSGIYTDETAHHRIAVRGRWELYDIEEDPHQDTDISDAHPAVVARMSEFYEAWWKKAERSLRERWGTNDEDD